MKYNKLKNIWENISPTFSADLSLAIYNMTSTLSLYILVNAREEFCGKNNFTR